METNNEQTFRADYKAEYLFKKDVVLKIIQILDK